MSCYFYQLILSGGALDVSDLLESKEIGAIVHAGQPGVSIMGVGDALFNLYGRRPSGRMVQTTYPKVLPYAFLLSELLS